MKLSNLRDDEIIEILSAIDAGFSIAFPPGVSAPVPVAELEAQVERLREAIEGALRIKKLWAPTEPWPDDHTGEAEALAIMENNFSQALAETEETL